MQVAGGVGGLLWGRFHNTPNLGTTNEIYCYDGNGNVSSLVNAATMNISATYDYGPFGELLRSNGEMAELNTYRFSTKPQDSSTGLYYYGYRWYDPRTGRWPSRDPIAERGGVNLYGFVGNDGVNKWDLLGLLTEWSDCSGYSDKGNKKFQVVNVFITSNTPFGDMPDDIIADFHDRLNSVQIFSTISSLAQMGSGGANILMNSVNSGNAADVVAGALGLNNPADPRDLVDSALNSIADSIGVRGTIGAMITVRYRCRTCVCEGEYWGLGQNNYKWDYPDPQDNAFTIDHGDNEVEPHERQPVGLRGLVSDVRANHLADAVFQARVACEGN